MRVTVKFAPIAFCCTALFTTLAMAPGARAESAFVQQAATTGRSAVQAGPLGYAPTQSQAPTWAPGAAAGWAPAPGPTATNPLAAAVPTTAGNFASTLEIGNYNKVFNAQLGRKDLSNVGIIGGNANTVGVFQNGDNLKSNIGLINTQGMPIAVIQQPGAAPVNMLIARLPNGGLLIRK